MSNQAPFPINAQHTGLAIAYKNDELIADMVLPRVPVAAKEFKYLNYPVAETFALPDTKVGRKSRPNVINLSATETSAFCEDYGLDDEVPQSDIDNAPPGHDPLARSAEQLTNYILLDREVRVANLVFAASTYPSGYKVQLSGNDQWGSGDAADTIIDDIKTSLETPLMRPNTLVFGQATWSKVSVHPAIVSAVLGNSGTKGIATRQQVAELFEVKRVLVGTGRLNTAKKGQTAVLSRVWGKHMAALYIDPMADTRNGISFGMTAQYKTRIAGNRLDPDIGLQGGIRNRVGEMVKELITASMAGYFIEDAVA